MRRTLLTFVAVLALSPVQVAVAADPIGMTNGVYVDPDSNPAIWVRNNGWDGRAARIQASIASKPMARWFGAWSGNVQTAVSSFVTAADAADKLPVLVAYNIPGRDACGGHSGGGAGTPEAYRAWISAFASGLGNRPAIVILEPDSLADFNCMTADAIATRTAMIRYATEQLRDKGTNTWAYLDAGNAYWVPAADMARRLDNAGVRNVRGMSINVSNYITTPETAAYGNAVSSALPGYTKPFVIDTSRNGNGSNGDWCNPPGRKIGVTAQIGGPAELLVWVKIPGDSDGPCGIGAGIPAGTFSPDLATRLIDGV
ncbi:glycoside hydrolase family 6 protein [Kibdelosporangium philippinense]|uniref:Glucanase n=1 Tax=Kibdelosporangium philippinense TaxID=211113 RepID=A0ABS8ZKI9_9PSEU|nr:glycoside hydrolase family 6 protein [Kibdelosporangium philippinense]MCE7008314.1 glycoside hydrolase family 6 protein [Kibdelosporangium philippinense]